MNKKRLLKLADFLEKLPPERFDFSRWVGQSWRGKPSLSCGTTACALGWAATIPSLRKLGLCIVKTAETDRYPSHVTLKSWIKKGFKHEDFSRDSNASLEAAAHVFEITPRDAGYLFYPLGSATSFPTSDVKESGTPSQVAQHIRDFVERGGRP